MNGGTHRAGGQLFCQFIAYIQVNAVIHPAAPADLIMLLTLCVKHDALTFKRETTAIGQSGFAMHMLVKNQFPIGV